MFFYFFAYPIEAFSASQAGVLLWFHQILPTLLPFCILSNVLLAIWNHSTENNAKQFCRISKYEWIVIICGMMFGFPIGSKLSADICKNGYISKERAQILCVFTNNMSPAFVSNFVCNQILQNNTYMIPMFLLLYGPPLLVGCVQLAATQNTIVSHKKSASRFQFDMQIIDTGIVSSFVTLIKLCGYIVMFSITADFISHIRFLPSLFRYLLIGFTEVTNGIAQLSYMPYPDSVKFLLALVFLSLGGLSGLAQTNSVLSGSGLKITKYMMLKICYTTMTLAIYLCILFFRHRLV